MRRILVVSLTLVVAAGWGAACGTVRAQEAVTPHHEYLRSYDQLIGQWQYEGPMQEDVPGVAQEGDEVLIRVSNRWILDKNVMESDYVFQVNGRKRGGAKLLVFWDPVEECIMEGGLNSTGGRTLSNVTYDEHTKTWLLASRGVDRTGKPTSETGMIVLLDENTYYFQALRREGGPVVGDGPRYTYRRVDQVVATTPTAPGEQPPPAPHD